MDIKRKLELAEQSIRSISTHEDEDAALRHAALDRIAAIVEREKKAIDADLAARIETATGTAPATEG
jgi:plasmid maintenance system antidote protein VapI